MWWLEVAVNVQFMALVVSIISAMLVLINNIFLVYDKDILYGICRKGVNISYKREFHKMLSHLMIFYRIVRKSYICYCDTHGLWQPGCTAQGFLLWLGDINFMCSNCFLTIGEREWTNFSYIGIRIVPFSFILFQRFLIINTREAW